MTEQLKLPEVARRLDVSEKTARRYVKSGALPSVFVGGAYRVSEETLEEFLQGAKATPGGDSPKVARRSSREPSFDDALEEERRAKSLRAWTALLNRIAGRWEEEARRPGAETPLDATGATSTRLFDAGRASEISTASLELITFVEEEVWAYLDRKLSQEDVEAVNEVLAALYRLGTVADEISDRVAPPPAISELKEREEARQRQREKEEREKRTAKIRERTRDISA